MYRGERGSKLLSPPPRPRLVKGPRWRPIFCNHFGFTFLKKIVHKLCTLRGFCFRGRFVPKFDVQHTGSFVISKCVGLSSVRGWNIPSVAKVEAIQPGQACKTSPSTYTLTLPLECVFLFACSYVSALRCCCRHHITTPRTGINAHTPHPFSRQPKQAQKKTGAHIPLKDTPLLITGY